MIGIITRRVISPRTRVMPFMVKGQHLLSTTTCDGETTAIVLPPTEAECERLGHAVQTTGFCVTAQPILSPGISEQLKEHVLPKLFRGDFWTGIYPDEWHWRDGLSLPGVTREICNAYKSDPVVASVILSEALAASVARVMGWSSVRIGQDDVIWKPPAVIADDDDATKTSAATTIGFHQDSAYISAQFEPYENNSATVWIALDDATNETGCLEYAMGSHLVETTDSGSHDHSSFHSANSDTYRASLPSSLLMKNNRCELLAVECQARHAVFHHQDVWHGSGPNRSTVQHRRALVGHYLRGDVQWRSTATTTTPPTIPWGNSSYIYGRYRRAGEAELDESFFPILYADPSRSGQARSSWLDEYLSSAKL